MSRIWDCFTFFNENDLVEIRLRHLWNRVDKFVIVEGSRTHSNHPKKRNFDPERFAWARDKIVYIWADLPAQDDRWETERYQRYHMLKGLEQASPDDILLVSDCDEFPSLAGLDHLQDMALPFGFIQKACGWWVNMYDPNLLWVGTMAATIAQLRETNNPEFFRKNRFGFPRIPCGGCHFTFVGGLERVVAKIGAFAHAEFDTPENKEIETLRKRRDQGFDPFGTGNFHGQELKLEDPNFPPYLREHKGLYPELFKTWTP